MSFSRSMESTAIRSESWGERGEKRCYPTDTGLHRRVHSSRHAERRSNGSPRRPRHPREWRQHPPTMDARRNTNTREEGLEREGNCILWQMERSRLNQKRRLLPSDRREACVSHIQNVKRAGRLIAHEQLVGLRLVHHHMTNLVGSNAQHYRSSLRVVCRPEGEKSARFATVDPLDLTVSQTHDEVVSVHRNHQIDEIGQCCDSRRLDRLGIEHTQFATCSSH